MTKLLIILLVSGALANGLSRTHDDPPLLIDPSPTSLDASR